MPTQITILSLNATLATGPSAIHPVLLRDAQTAVLVDAGLPDTRPQLLSALESEGGVAPSNLTHIVLTHADMDHVGGLTALSRQCPTAEILCHEREKPYVQADVPPLRLAQMEGNLAHTPEPLRTQMEALVANLRANYKKLGVRVTKSIDEGEALLPCGAEVVYTPGHTPGHICLYLKESRTLIAGDALFAEGGVLSASPERLAWDTEEYKRSLRKLAGYDIETVICYHGGAYDKDVNQRLKEIAGE
jgi:glyoxylase-like metal-dependent hydrolase (beta-lactamase superfamily II)